MSEIQSSILWQSGDAKLKELVALDTSKLQVWVRASFLSEHCQTKSLQQFVNSIVRPALRCNVSTVPGQLADVLGRFTAIIQGSSASEEDIANMKIASAAIKGDLSAHPLVQGLALQCRRMIEKQSRGLTNMVGRKASSQSTNVL